MPKHQNITFHSVGRLSLVMLLLLLFTPLASLLAQDADAEPVRSRMSLSTTQIQGDSIELQALLRAKFEQVYEQIPYEDIEFITVDQEGEEISLGKDDTDVNGIAKIIFGKSAIPIDEEGYMTFSARFSGNSELRESDSDVSILPASLSITPIEDDSMYTLQVNALTTSVDGELPLTEADVSVQVQRMVGMLKVGEGTTDENGVAEIEFPDDLTGDDNGNVYITAFVEDFEEYGNLSVSTAMPWGKPVSSLSVHLPRALWSPYPPTWLFVTFLSFLAIIWAHYIDVIIGLIRVKRAAKAE